MGSHFGVQMSGCASTKRSRKFNQSGQLKTCLAADLAVLSTLWVQVLEHDTGRECKINLGIRG